MAMVANHAHFFISLASIGYKCMRSSGLKFSAPNGPVLTNISNCHVFFSNLADRQKRNSMHPPSPDYNTFDKVWVKLDENCESSILLKILSLEICKVHRMTPK